MAKVVVVESPSKAKTIQKYLGASYKVMSSYGHIRDLPSKNGSVKPDEDFKMEWALLEKSQKNSKSLLKEIKTAEALYLATDPDREGEAISWHIMKLIEENYPKLSLPIHRVSFNAITAKTIKEAFAHPREVDQPLVNAYLARRALDYLVGFSLSPVLWRKLPGSKSAGRVQSVALRLIAEREVDIESFKKQEYWSIQALIAGASHPKNPFLSRLVALAGEKIEKLTLKNEEEAFKAKALIESGQYTITKVETKPVKRNPAPPFITSTLQQEASRKIGLNATRTMRLAQQLYEGVDIGGGEVVGLITYMRTDGVDITEEALTQIRNYIGESLGKDYLPKSPRIYKTKAKNAQEAHEAIRPTDIERSPEALQSILDADLHKLYTLIWKRTVASQMSSAELDQKTIEIESKTPHVLLRATGSTLKFAGFLSLYQEGIDDKAEDEDQEALLPDVKLGEAVSCQEVKPAQHFTEPPPRFSEATLVKKLEELGIGRPSTYAAILQVLQDREYVRIDKKRFFAEERGRLVASFLKHFFSKYVEYDFTAHLEEQLDDVSNGKLDWKLVLKDFWTPFAETIDSAQKLPPKDIVDTLEKDLEQHYFKDQKGNVSRVCPQCNKGTLQFKIGKFGAFIACDQYPECKHTQQLGIGSLPAEEDNNMQEDSSLPTFPRSLGTHPETQEAISVRKGPYGFYLQQDVAEKPKRAPLPAGFKPETVTLEQALQFLMLPKNLGFHPETKEIIAVGIGKYGPYIKNGTAFVKVPKGLDIFTLSFNQALEIIAATPPKAAAPAKAPPKKAK
jgi:DNA topoisomerase I